MRILQEKCICLVVDIQEKLVPVIHDQEAVIRNCSKLIKGMEILNVPVVASQQYTKGLGETVPEISSLFNPFRYTEKRSFSCLDEPSFSLALANSGKNVVLICGIESHVCVLQTAIDLQENGYIPVIVEDCTGSRKSEDKSVAIRRFLVEGIRVTTAESLLFELTRSSEAPEFRSISALVR